MSDAMDDENPKELSDREASFVIEYLVDLNASAAARRVGYRGSNSGLIGWQLMRRPHVRAAIDDALQRRAERTKVEADHVLLRLWTIATADPRELIEYRRGACRYCYGKGHDYQRTARERRDDFAVWAIENAKTAQPPFDEKGGVGYNPRSVPHPGCPECHGEGEPRLHIADTRTMSPEALHLFAGIKQTRDGIEVKMHDQRAALVDVGRHLGMFTDNVNVKTPVGGIAVRVTHEIVDPSAPPDA